jgi:hypothetical protein
MYTEIFQQLGLAKNEAKIYETLLKEGESSVGNIDLLKKDWFLKSFKKMKTGIRLWIRTSLWK